jgi:putative addiction module killer protein
MLPSSVAIEEYLDDRGQSPFSTWFGELDARAAAKVTVALSRIERGAVSNVKGVGEGVLEFRIDFGPGYRIYFGRDGDRLVILLAGGTKRRQDKDIANAKARWDNYKARQTRAWKEGGAGWP